MGARTTQDSLCEVRPPQQCTVKVTGLSEKISKDLLTNYFENVRRSKGGPISKINLDSDLQECLITFESPDGRFLRARLYPMQQKTHEITSVEVFCNNTPLEKVSFLLLIYRR